jgi:hypothetical protein
MTTQRRTEERRFLALAQQLRGQRQVPCLCLRAAAGYETSQLLAVFETSQLLAVFETSQLLAVFETLQLLAVFETPQLQLQVQ